MSKQDELLDTIVESAEDDNWQEFDNAVGELRELLSRPSDEKRLEVPEPSLSEILSTLKEMDSECDSAPNDYWIARRVLEKLYAALSHKEAPQTEPKVTGSEN